MFSRKLLISVVLIGGFVVVSGVLGKAVPGGFVPEEDQGYATVNVMLPDAAALGRTDQVCRKVEAILAKNPAVSYFSTATGFSLMTSSYAPNTAFVFVAFKPWEERSKKERSFEVIAQLNREFSNIAEAQVMAFGPPAILGLGNASGFSIMLQDLVGKSPEFLAENATKFIAAASKRPELANLFTTFRANTPQILLDVDREKVLKQGLSLSDVNTSIGAFLGSAYVNDFNRFGRIYKVYIQADARYRSKPDTLGLLTVRSADGVMTPLSTLVKVKNISGPQSTVRFNLFRSVEVNGIPAPGYSSAQATKALEEVAAATLPPEMGYDWYGMTYQEKKAEGTAGLVFALSILFVFLILAAQYESWSLPLSVLLGTPFAVFGALLGLFLSKNVNNVFAQIGIILLIGLAAKNAILIVEFARMKFSEGVSLLDSALEAARLRFRPILMTAFAFILGVVPLVTASGAGAEARKVMGASVFSGMLVATILGVLLVPALFVLVNKLNKSEKNRKTGPTPVSGTAHS